MIKKKKISLFSKKKLFLYPYKSYEHMFYFDNTSSNMTLTAVSWTNEGHSLRCVKTTDFPSSAKHIQL